MASTLPIVDPCCVTTCTSTTTVQIPGPKGEQGPAGADGAPGAAGLNAYTTLTANFTMPAELANAQATVANTGWMVVGQILYVATLGYMEVVTIDSNLLVTLKNLENTATSSYTSNAAPGTIAGPGSRVGPGGRQGPPGLFAQIYEGRGPANPPDDPTQPALSYATGGGQMLQWIVATQLWA